MKYSEKEMTARKQIAMAAANFLINQGFVHVTVSITIIRAEVTLFFDFADDLEAAKKLVMPFMIDGAAMESGENCTDACDHFYYLTLDWL